MSEDTATEYDDIEAELVRAWRVLQAGCLGLEWADAIRVADSDIDVHKLADLVDAGCPPLTAIDILI